MAGMEGTVNLVQTNLTREGYFVADYSEGVNLAEFNTIAENDYRSDAFTKLSRRAIYGSGLLFFGLLLAGCAPKPPGPEGGGGVGGDSDSNTDSLCPNLLRMAAANSVDVAVGIPAWQVADQVQLQEDLACFVPESISLTVGEILTVGPNAGSEVVQLAWASGGEVKPLLAVPGAQIDDLQLVNFFSPKTSQWEALGPDQAQTSLTAVNINVATGDIEAESSGTVIKATRDFNQNISFQIVNPDGTAVVLSQDQVKNNLALAPWLTQVENLLTGQEVLTFDVAPGIDVGNIGEKYSLPQEVFALAREKHLAPIEAEGSIASACTTDSCTVMLTNQLVTGAQLQSGTDGKVSYGFDGEAGSEALFRFNGLPEGVRATAFVAQEGNPWGFKAGTVVVWFWQGGSKGPATILNPDNPLQIIADTPNSISLTAIDNGLRITRTGPDGAVIDEQRVAFLPPLPSEFLAKYPNGGYEIVDKKIMVNGEVWFELNSAGEWEKIQRTITFDLEGGGTMEMFEFDTLEETFEYIVIKDGATWMDRFEPKWGARDPKYAAFYQRLFQIPGIGDEFMKGKYLGDSSSRKYGLPIMVYSMGDGAIITYLTDEGNLKPVFVEENASALFARLDQEPDLVPPSPQP